MLSTCFLPVVFVLVSTLTLTLTSTSSPVAAEHDWRSFVREISTSLTPAFEKHALLLAHSLKQTDDEAECTLLDGCLESVIPTLRQNSKFSFNTLLEAKDIDMILSHPNVECVNSDERMEAITGGPSPEVVANPFTTGRNATVGRQPSLCNPNNPFRVYHLERYWAPMADWSRFLETELQVSHVTCRLQVIPSLPPNVNSSWAVQSPARWDWKDTLVIPIHGESSWRISKEAMIPYPTEELMAIQQQQQHQQQSTSDVTDQRYTEFILHPDDVLFIPRGTLHNTTTLLSIRKEIHDMDNPIPCSWFLMIDIEPTGCLVMDWMLHCLNEEFHGWVRLAMPLFPIMRRNVVVPDRFNVKLSIRASFMTAMDEFRLWVSDECPSRRRQGSGGVDGGDENSLKQCREASMVPIVYWEDAMAGYARLLKQIEHERALRWETEDAVLA